MLIRELTKIFSIGITETAYFEGWVKEKPREYWQRGPDLVLGVDLQLDKWWKKNGGWIAVNLSCGHRWTVPTFGWVNDDIDYCNTRLSPSASQDHWWQIRSDGDMERFGVDFRSLLHSQAVPWFEQVSTKQGYLEWYSSIFPEPATFPYVMELYGRSELKRRVCMWLASAPRGIERTLDWLVKTAGFSRGLADKVRLASIQAEAKYMERLPALIEEIEQNAPSND